MNSIFDLKIRMHRFLKILPVLAIIWSSNAFAVGIGQPAPAFERVPLMGGEPIELKDYLGQVVYLDFWASWCGPCRQAMPLMNSMYQELSGQGFTVLAVNLDAYVDEALRFIKQHPVQYPMVRDTGGVLPELYGLTGMPTAYLIDRNGKVRYIHHGFKRSDVVRIRHAVESLLAESQYKTDH